MPRTGTLRRPVQVGLTVPGCTLHVVTVGVNRIGKDNNVLLYLRRNMIYSNLSLMHRQFACGVEFILDPVSNACGDSNKKFQMDC